MKKSLLLVAVLVLSQLNLVGKQVMTFARMKIGSHLESEV